MRIVIMEEGVEYQKPEAPQISAPEQVHELCKEMVGTEEHFAVVCLNAKNRVMSVEILSAGNHDSSIVDPSVVLRTAIRRYAHTIILVHNHPSGDLTPSPADIAVTRRVVAGGDIIGIPVMDHCIISDTDLVSMRTMGLMEFAS